MTAGSDRGPADDAVARGPATRSLADGPTVAQREIDLAADYAASCSDAIAPSVDRTRMGEPYETAPADNLRTLEVIERA